MKSAGLFVVNVVLKTMARKEWGLPNIGVGSRIHQHGTCIA